MSLSASWPCIQKDASQKLAPNGCSQRCDDEGGREKRRRRRIC